MKYTFSKSSQHARSFEFTKKNFTLYQDNSLNKATRIKSVHGTRGLEFQKRERLLKELIKNNENIKVKRKAEVKIRGIIEENLKEYSEMQKKLNQSAVLIQKHVRGYLARRNCGGLFDQRVKKHAVKCVDNMQKVIYSMWIDLKYFVHAAGVIETHFLRFKSRKKLLSVIDLYNKYCYDKKAERFRVFEYIQHIAARLKLWVLKQPLVIKTRLEMIKKNLALIKVKNYWKLNGLSIAKVVARAKKFKKIMKFKMKVKRTASESKEKFCSPFIWRYSMIELPIEWNENILLGAEPVRKMTRKGGRGANGRKVNNRMNFRNKVENVGSPVFMNLPLVAGNFASAGNGVGAGNAISDGRAICGNNIMSAGNTFMSARNFIMSAGKLPSQRTPSRASATGGIKVEIIHYSSPLAESLGYKGFQFKVWRPIFGEKIKRGSLTPTVPRSNFLKGSHLKPQTPNPIRILRKT